MSFVSKTYAFDDLSQVNRIHKILGNNPDFKQKIVASY